MAKISNRLGRLGVDWKDPASGKRRWKSFKTEADAHIFLGQLLAEQGRPQAVDVDIPLANYVSRWIGLCALRVRPSSLALYKKKLELHILPALGLHSMRDLTGPVLRDWLALKASKGMAKNSVKSLLFILSSIFALAVQDGIVRANPCEGLSKVLGLGRSQGQAEEIRAMTADQLSAFLESVRGHYPQYYVLFATLALTGLRVGEALGLQWQDLDLTAGTLLVERQFHRDGRVAPPKTMRSRRTVDIGPEMVALYRNARRARDEADLKAGRRDTPWVMAPWPAKVSLADSQNARRMIAYVMTRALRKAGLPEHFSPHALRHTYASLHLSRGESPKYVQEQMGHDSIAVTVDTYGRWLPTRRPEAAAALEASVLKIHTA